MSDVQLLNDAQTESSKGFTDFEIQAQRLLICAVVFTAVGFVLGALVGVAI